MSRPSRSSVFLALSLLMGSLFFSYASGVFAAAPTNGLIGYWKLDATSGTTAVNSAGTSYNGTLQSTPTWTAAGKVNGAVTFNGSDNIAIGNITQLSNASQVTVSAWIKRSAVNGKVLMGRQSGANGGAHTIAIEAWYDGNIYFGLSGTGGYVGGYFASNDTDWHHVALVFNGTLSGNSNRLKGYVDGVQRTLGFTGTVPAATSSNTTPFNIGKVQGTYSEGMIDEVRVYNRALAANEVLDVMNDGQTPDTTAPTVPTNLSVTPASSTELNLSWTASTDTTGVTGYQIYRNGTLLTNVTSGTTYNDTGLTASTTYSYRIAAYDAAGNVSALTTAVNGTTQSPPDTTPPTIVSVSSDKAPGTYTTGEVIDIDLTFSEPVTSTGNVTVTLETGTTDRTCTFTITNATTGTCNYTVQAGDTSADLTTASIAGTIRDQANNTLTNFTPATTLAANEGIVVDAVAPTAAITTPTDNDTVSGTGVAVSVTASDNVSVAGVQFRLDGADLGVEDVEAPFGTAWDTTGAAEGTHVLEAVVRDTVGNATTTAAVTVTVDNVDEVAPTINLTEPTNGTTLSGTVNISATATDNVAVVGVQFSLNGSALQVEDTTSPYSIAWDTAAVSDGAHTLSATARDAAGNTATAGTITVNVNNTTPPDTTDPSVPTGLTVVPVSTTELSLSWDAATDDTAVTGYRVYRNGAEIGTSSTTNYSDTGLTPSTTYAYTIAAFDAAGNASAESGSVDGTTLTPPDTTAPTVSVIVPADGATVSGGVAVSADAADNIGIVGVQFRLDGSDFDAEDTTNPYGVLWDTTTATEGAHVLTAVARDAAGNAATAADVSVIVDNVSDPDTTAPTVPTSLSVTPASSTELNLSWSASTDTTGVTGYQIYRDGTLLTNVTSGTTYNDTGLTASTTYSYRIAAYDAAGNVSAQTAEVSGATLADGGTQLPSATFPLTVSSDKRRLLDKNGGNFIINGDTPWSLEIVPTREEVDQYLADRESKGFNAVLFEVMEHAFAPNPPYNVYGDAPFTTPGDFSTPNEAYFAHLDYVIQKVYEYGMAAFITPTYLGYGGGGEGWYQEVLANGPTKMYEFGRYLGTRYQEYPNIIWVMGGDFAPNQALDETQALVQGLQETSTVTVMTAHNSRYESAVTKYPANEPWLNLNNTYAHCDSAPQYLAADYNRSGPYPFFYIEGTYENGVGDGGFCFRAQPYWSVLMGGVGHFMGNDPLWFMGAGWQNSLNSEGSQDIAHFADFLQSRPFGSLVPDYAHAVLTNGYGALGQDYAAAARTTNGSTVIVYTPSQRALTIDLTQISGTQAKAWWFNPHTGVASLDGTYATTGAHVFTPPEYGDSVLVIDDASLNLPAPGTVTTTPDTTPPTVSLSAPTNGATVSGNVTVTATASDNVGIAGVQFRLDSVNIGAEDTTAPYSVTWNTTTASNALHTLTAVARDAASNTATSTGVAVTVNNATDTTPPTVPTSLTVTPASSTQLNLSWSASTDNVGVTSYEIFRNGTSIATVNAPTTTYQDTGLTASTTYTYTVLAKDAANNASAQTAGVQGTTQEPPVSDTTAPVISAVNASALTASGATIAWSTDEAADTQVEYGVTTSYGQTTTLDGTLTTAHSQALIGLTAATTYHYRVQSRDAAGNLAVSADSTFVTAVAPSSDILSGLLGYWNFDQGSGSTLPDQSGNGYTGAFQGTPTWGSGKLGGGLVYNDGDNVDLGSALPIQSVSQLTLSAWVKRSSTNGKVEIGKQESGGPSTVAIELWYDGLVYFGLSDASSYAAGMTPLNDTNWHHVTMVYDGTKSGNAARLKGYVDGVEAALSFTGTVPATTTASTTPFGIGYLTGAYSDGSIDEVRVYSRALAPEDVAALYSFGL